MNVEMSPYCRDGIGNFDEKEILQRYLILDVVKETTSRTKVLLFELGLF
jgi:hypothetical protein